MTASLHGAILLGLFATIVVTSHGKGEYYYYIFCLVVAVDRISSGVMCRRRGGARRRRNVASGDEDGVCSMEEKADDAIGAVLGVQMLLLRHLCHHALLFRHQLPTSQQALWRLRLCSQVMPLYCLLHLTVFFLDSLDA